MHTVKFICLSKMRITNLKLVVLISVISTVDCSASEDRKHIFILAGQSNMWGMDPQLVFQPMVEEAFGKDSVIIVKDAEGGAPILRWYKKWDPKRGGGIPVDRKTEKPAEIGDIYERLLVKLKEATADTEIASVTLCWMQGESDTYHPRCNIYGESFLGMMAQLEKDLKHKDINVVIGRISDARMQVPEWVKIRQVQMKLAETHDRWSWINTDDCNDGPAKNGKTVFTNNVHYSDKGKKLFDSRMAGKAIELISRTHTK